MPDPEKGQDIMIQEELLSPEIFFNAFPEQDHGGLGDIKPIVNLN
jgi:hypothetical protein